MSTKEIVFLSYLSVFNGLIFKFLLILTYRKASTYKACLILMHSL